MLKSSKTVATRYTDMQKHLWSFFRYVWVSYGPPNVLKESSQDCWSETFKFSQAGHVLWPQSHRHHHHHHIFIEKLTKCNSVYICRLPENTPASQALQLSIEAHTGTPPVADWKHPPGRPRRNWLQQVEEDVGLSVGAAWIAGQDRSIWRTLRPSAGQAQQWVSEWVSFITWCLS